MAFEQSDKTPASESTNSAAVLSQQIQRLFPDQQPASVSKIPVYETAPIVLADDKLDGYTGSEWANPGHSHDAIGAPLARALGAWSSAYVSLDRRPITGTRLYPMKRVSSKALSEVSTKSMPAYQFLDAEVARLKGQTLNLRKGITTTTSETSDDESMLATRIKTVNALKDQIPPGRMGSLEKVDLTRLADDTRAQKAFGAVTDFEQAQSTAIAEHQADMARLTAEERVAYANTRRATTASFCNDVGALFGAQAAELAIDWFTPRNFVSKKTIVADFIIPAVAMGMDMSPLGKWAPLARAGIMVGTHAAFHLAFDKQVDNNNK